MKAFLTLAGILLLLHVGASIWYIGGWLTPATTGLLVGVAIGFAISYASFGLAVMTVRHRRRLRQAERDDVRLAERRLLEVKP